MLEMNSTSTITGQLLAFISDFLPCHGHPFTKNGDRSRNPETGKRLKGATPGIVLLMLSGVAKEF
jgi:hypothetical protein